MPAPTKAEVGPVYDLLLQTRDGSTLACTNADGKTVNVSQVAFMGAINPQVQQHEETELAHKDRLIQFASSNLIDREFDQWPQVTQGDWTGGTKQRVFSGPNADPTRYWDNIGILWPIDDYIPQRSLLATADRNENGARMFADFQGVASGRVVAAFGTANCFAYQYMQQAAPNNHILVLQSIVGNKVTFTNPPGTTANIPASNHAGDFVIAFGLLWSWAGTGGGNSTISSWDGNAVSFTTRLTVTNAIPSNGGNPARIAAGVAGNKSYLAVTRYVGAPNQQATVRLCDLTTISAGLITGFVDIPILSDSVGVLSNIINIEQMEFLGDVLYIAVTDTGSNGWIIAFNISSQTSSVVARFTQVTNIHICAVSGGLFVLAVNNLSQSPNNLPMSVDQYLLQGSTLQYIGPVLIPQPGNSNPLLSATSDPQAFGSYAIFPVVYNPTGQTQPSRVGIFAYDVLRGRNFHLDDIGTYESLLNTNYGRRGVAVVGPMTHNSQGGVFTSQWSTVANVLSSQGTVLDITNVQRSLFSVSTAGGAFLQHGTQITSSLIDFTSAQNKLYRQAVLSFTPLPTEPTITVQLDIWLDQDVANLAATPDFTTGAVGNGVNGGVVGQKQLKLLINRIARKLVYRVTAVGPFLNLITGVFPAVKVVSVATQAATGWTQTLVLDLASRMVTNTKAPNDFCWDRQSVSGATVDNVVAYNFLRQLWRLKGGEVIATFPNGDTGNWLLQDMHFDSPKPFAVSVRADQKTNYQTIVTVKIREDV